MSLHNEPKSKQEVEGLLLHRLKVGQPSQLSDCFILGMRWEQTLKFGELEKATKSLKSAGFTDEGGELWKPPVNKEAGKWVTRSLDAEDRIKLLEDALNTLLLSIDEDNVCCLKESSLSEIENILKES